MPKEIKKHQTVLEAILSVDIISELLEKHDGHFEHELDLEVIAYGRNYNGKKVGPYVHLLEYEAGEEVIREGDWGGNTFFVTVDGKLVDRVYFIRSGWIRRARGLGYGAVMGDLPIEGLSDDAGVDFLGAGNCLGLEGAERDTRWAYTAVVLQRTEVLEVAMPPLRADSSLRDTVVRTFSDFSLADDDVRLSLGVNKPVIAATE